MGKPLYLKSTFWKRIPAYHPALYGTLLKGSMRSQKKFNDFDIAEVFKEKRFSYQEDTYHQYSFWINSFNDRRNLVRQVLEIGSFEGRSTVFMAWLFPHASITCIDPFVNSSQDGHISNIETTFLGNTENYASRIEIIKDLSYAALAKLIDRNRQFDLIYIDGSHSYNDVLLDSLLSWRLLEVGGIIVWDDYIFSPRQKDKLGSKLAIDQFLTAYRGHYEVIFAWKQVAICRLRHQIT